MTGLTKVAEIPGRLVTLNEYVNAERGNRFAAASMKKSETLRVEEAFYGLLWAGRYPVDVEIVWNQPTKKLDPDNVAFAIKFILDGMVKSGFIRGDGAKQIKSISHKFVYGTDYKAEVYLGG